MRFVFAFLLLLSSFLLAVAQDNSLDTTEYVEDEHVSDETYASTDNEENSETPHTLRDPNQLHQTQTYSTQVFPVKKFEQKKWKSIVGSTDYDEKKQPEPKIEKKANENIMPRIPLNGAFLRIVAYAVILGIVIFIIYYILKNITIPYSIATKKITNPNDFVAVVENIEDLDIQSMLKQTLAAGDFKLAVRIYFLGLLKKLNEGGIIAWKKDKTNRDYLSEIFAHDYCFDNIKQLTLVYEEVWYGEHTITKDSFENLAANFESVYKNLNTYKA